MIYVSFDYDRAGNMTDWSDGVVSGSTIYDELNRPLSVSTIYPSFSKTVSYTYNRFGQRETMTDGESQLIGIGSQKALKFSIGVPTGISQPAFTR